MNAVKIIGAGLILASAILWFTAIALFASPADNKQPIPKPLSVVGTYYIGQAIPTTITIYDADNNGYKAPVNKNTAFWSVDGLKDGEYYHYALVDGIPRKRTLLSYTLQDEIWTHNVIILPEGSIEQGPQIGPVGQDTSVDGYRVYLPLVLR